ncbi:MAG: hypothetical protein ABIQ93_05455, partial [Saprospiraceae bacterium]
MNNHKLILLLALLCSLAWIPANAQSNTGISGKVQFDFDNDCVADVDSFLYGTVVDAWQNGQLIATTTVGVQGQYFLPVPAGDYLVVPHKYSAAYPFCPADTLPATVVQADTTGNIDFVQEFAPQPVTSISGYIFEDVDGDCHHDG